MYILLVEDDELILETLGDALTEAGHETVRRLSAEDALETLAFEKPQVVITDINLGRGMDGLALGRALRRRFPDLPVIYISGRYPEVRGLSESERFLPKPFAASTLLQAVADVARTPGTVRTEGTFCETVAGVRLNGRADGRALPEPVVSGALV